MLIYCDSSTNEVINVTEHPDFNIGVVNTYGLLNRITHVFGQIDMHDDINVIYVKERFDGEESTLKTIFNMINECGDGDLPTHLFVDNRSEPRDFKSSTFFNLSIKKYGVKPENVHVLTATCTYIPKEFKSKLIFFPYDGFNFFSITKDNENFKIGSVNKTILLTSFNRRLTTQRIVQTAEIINRFNEEDYIISLGVDTEKFPEMERNHFNMWCNKDVSLPISVDKEYVDINDVEQFKIDIGQSKNSIFDVVNETIASSGLIGQTNAMHREVYYPSEKTFRPFFNHQIPIFNSTIGYTEWFSRAYGFDMFEDVLDYRKWDNVHILKQRSDIICDELENFKNKFGDYNQFYEDHKERFAKNYVKVKKITNPEFYIRIKNNEDFHSPHSGI
jgi:hypothetical protein